MSAMSETGRTGRAAGGGGDGGSSAGDASSDAAAGGSAAAADTDTVTSSALEWMHHLPSMSDVFTHHNVYAANENEPYAEN